MKLLFLIALFYVLSQIANRLRNSDRGSGRIKTEFQAAIDDAKERLPSTGLFQVFKGQSSGSKPIEEPVTERTVKEQPISESKPSIEKTIDEQTIAEILAITEESVVEAYDSKSSVDNQLEINEALVVDDLVIKAAFEAKSTKPNTKETTLVPKDISCLIDDDEVPLNECKEKFPVKRAEDSVDDQSIKAPETEID